MPLIAEAANGTVTETGANTATWTQVACPNAAGAKRVILKSVELSPYSPDNTATKAAAVGMAVQKGHVSTGSPSLATNGSLTQRSRVRFTDGTDPIHEFNEGPEYKDVMQPLEKHTDGNYYVSVGIQGSSCTAARSGKYRLDFLVDR